MRVAHGQRIVATNSVAAEAWIEVAVRRERIVSVAPLPCPPDESVVGIREAVIDFGQQLIAIRPAQAARVIGLERAGDVRRGDERQHLLRNRVEHRFGNHVRSRELGAGEGRR